MDGKMKTEFIIGQLELAKGIAKNVLFVRDTHVSTVKRYIEVEGSITPVLEILAENEGVDTGFREWVDVNWSKKFYPFWEVLPYRYGNILPENPQWIIGQYCNANLVINVVIVHLMGYGVKFENTKELFFLGSTFEQCLEFTQEKLGLSYYQFLEPVRKRFKEDN
jgi:hypothetical protein